MKKVVILSTLLILGLLLGQARTFLSVDLPSAVGHGVEWLTLIGLAFIMIGVGLEFHIEKERLRAYGWDYVVAMTAATFPWILVFVYFVVFLLPASPSAEEGWAEALLVSRFAAPTSAGILFSMLVAAGLGLTWVYTKARVLAIFDDLDTVLLMIPLTMIMVGFVWQLLIVVAVIVLLLWVAFARMHALRLPSSWTWMLLYAVILVALTEGISWLGDLCRCGVPLHIEVLLPAFVLGVVIRPSRRGRGAETDEKVSFIVSMVFVFMVGFGMPAVSSQATGEAAMSAGELLFHVLMVTLLSNLGKMFPLLCYRAEATIRERLALSIGMWPRGEVGAGVLVIAVGHDVQGPMVSVAMLSLVLNLALTGVFIFAVRRLIAPAAAK